MTAPARQFELAELLARQASSATPYHEFLRVPALSCGLYVLPAGGTDGQSPHNEDEMYYVVEGRSRFVADGVESDVQAGTVLFVKAGIEHRFFDIAEELRILVFFAPAET